MNNRSITTASCVAIAAAMALSACGTDDEGLRAGDIELGDESRNTDPDVDAEPAAASSGEAVALKRGAPDYCQTLIDLEATSDDFSSDAAVSLYIELLDGLSADGPEALRSTIATHAEEARAVKDYDINFLDPDRNEVTPDQFKALIAFADGAEEFNALGEELLPVFREDCGDELVDSFGDSSMLMPGPTNDAVAGQAGTAGSADPQAQQAPSPTGAGDDSDATALFVPFTEVVPGPFGVGEVSNATIEITDAVWSNRRPSHFLDPEREPFEEDTDRRFLYLTVDVINNDPNDAMDADPDYFSLIDGSGKGIAAEDSSTGSGVGRNVAALTAQTKTLGFELGEVVDVSTLSLRFADDAVPEIIDVVPTGEAAPALYPIEVTPPAAGEYIGSNTASCGVSWTWAVDTATVLLDLPAELNGVGSALNGRANIGQRWIRLTGSVTTGDSGDEPSYLCSGNINNDDFRLVVDGLGSVPIGAPNTALGTDESLTVDLFWSIPTDSTELAIRGVGADGNSFDSPFTLPELPTVRGE